MKKSKPNVVFITYALSGGGAERALLEVFSAFDRQHFNPRIWRLNAGGEYPEYLTGTDSVELLPPLLRDPLSLARVEHCRRQLPDYLQKVNGQEFVADGLRLHERLVRLLSESSNPVLIFSSQYSMNMPVAIMQWLDKYQVPVVFIEQNEPYLRFFLELSPGKRDLAWGRIRELYPRADAIIAVSAAVKGSLVSRFEIDSAKITVINNPVSFRSVRALISGPAPDHPFYKGKLPVLVCLARLNRQKNHQMLLRSFALVTKVVPANLILLGDGELKGSLQATVNEMGLDGRVALLGFQSNPIPFISSAALTILASYVEGHSLAILESLACGVPVVSTNWHGVEEVIQNGKNGVICEMNDEALAAGILAGLNMGKLKTVRDAARATAKNFDTKKIAAEYVELAARQLKPGSSPVRNRSSGEPHL